MSRAWTVRVEVVPNDSMAEPSDYGPFRSPEAAHRFEALVQTRFRTAAVAAQIAEEWGEESFLSVSVIEVLRPTVRAVLTDWRVA